MRPLRRIWNHRREWLPAVLLIGIILAGLALLDPAVNDFIMKYKF